MRKPDDTKNPLLELLDLAGQTLIAIGTPPLFFLKILLWTGVWFFRLSVQFLSLLLSIVAGIGETVFWVGRVVSEGLGIFLAEVFPRARRWLGILQQAIVFWRGRLQKKRVRIYEKVKEKAPRISWPELPQLPTLRKFYFILLGFILAIPLLLFPFWVKTELSRLPDPRLLTVRDIPVSTKIYDRNGVLLYQIYTDENRNIVNLEELPKYVVDATIAIEDKNFYKHLGFDLAGITRAVFANTSGVIDPSGGSTITQQLIRSALLTPERTIARKIKEIILSFWAERIYSKKQVLTMYLNQIPYGGAAYGIDAAAETYFGKKAGELTLAEAALLAGLPSAPSTYSPFGAQPQLAKERQKQVLSAMVGQGYITEFAAKAAEQEELHFVPPETSIKAPHFVMYVKDYLVAKYGIRRVEQGGLEVLTSLDYSLYETVNKLLREGVEKQKYLRVGNGAALVTDPSTEEILAMVGSIDFFDLAHDGNVNVTTALRSPGSAIKPLNYALAFEKGALTPASVIDDSPIIYRVANQPPYAPGNYDGKFHGKVSARVALASSYNVPAVKVLEKNGVAEFIGFAKKLGITSFSDPSRYGLALTLGGGEVRMTEMAQAFSAFANQGRRTDLRPVLKVKDYRGNVLEDNSIEGRAQGTGKGQQVISPQTAFLISSILADDGARAPTFGAGSVLNIFGRTVAVKTGTTETKRDNWTIGYSFGQEPRVVAVWVGNNDNSPMSPFLESGNTGAAAIWNAIMASLLQNQPNSPIPQPENIIAVSVCALTGTLPCENCPKVVTEYYVRGMEPKQACKISKEELEKLQEGRQ